MCNVYSTVVHVCLCCQSPCGPCIQIDATDLIKPVRLHVECQHFHQAQWETNVGIGRIDPVDSAASAQSRNQRPLRSKAMILSWDPRREGNREGGSGLGVGVGGGGRGGSKWAVETRKH